MRNPKFAGMLLATISFVMISGCEFGNGRKLEFKKGEVFYKSGISEDDAKKLGDYLVEIGYFNDNTDKSVQLAKDGDTHQLKVVVADGDEKDAGKIATYKFIATKVNNNVFKDNQHELILVDTNLKTLGVVGYGYGKLLTFKKGQIYCDSSAKEEEAKKLGEFFIKDDYFDDKSAKTVQLAKKGDTYQCRMVVKEGTEKNEGLVKLFKDAGLRMSKELFDGKNVEIHFCDTNITTVHVIKTWETAGKTPAKK